MKKKIEKLTAQQEIALEQQYKDYLAIGLDTKLGNRQVVKRSIEEIYEYCGKKKPKFFVWGQSPFAIQLMMNICKKMTLKSLIGEISKKLHGQLRDQLYGQLGGQLDDQLGAQLDDQLGDQLYGQLGGQLRGQLGDQLYGQLGAQLGGQLRAQLRGQLGGQLRDQLYGQLGGQLRDQLDGQLYGQLYGQLGDQLYGQLGDQLRAQLRDQLYGQLEYFSVYYWYFGGSVFSYWIAYYDFAEKIGVQYPVKESHMLQVFKSLALNCFFWHPFEDIVFISEKPSFISMENRVLNSENKAAVEFRDGYKLWALEGVQVTEQIVMAPETLTIEQINKESNAEVKRIMIQRFGPKKYLLESGAECLDFSAGLGLQGSAPRALYRTKDGMNWLFSSDGSTQRCYYMAVPNEAMTCAEAHKMISGLDDERRILAEC